MLPTEHDLHAWLDGELPPERLAAVTEYLGRNAEDSRRLQAYRADGAAIARLFANADQLMSRRARPASVRARGARFFRSAASSRAWQLAAVFALFIFSAGLGWLWHGGGNDARANQFAIEAAAAHQATARAAPSVEVTLDEVAQFLSAPLTTPVKLRLPAAGEYSLVGSRYLTTPRGRVVQLTFRASDQTVITMYLAPWAGTKDTPFRPVVTGRRDITTLFWTDDEVACAVTSTLPADRLEAAARAIYEAVFS